MDRFLTVDVETASKTERGSICQIAIVEYNEGEIYTLYTSLVNPECYFDECNCAIHGITPAMVQDSPTFQDIWPDIEPILTSAPIIAHNAIFDMSVLERSMYIYQIPPVELFYTCSLMAARRAFPDLKSYKLSSLCEYFGIEYTDHHDAEADAIACCELTLKICEEMNANSLRELVWRCGVNYCSTFNNNYDPEDDNKAYPPMEVSSKEGLQLMPKLELECNGKEFFKGKVIVFTGQMYSLLRSEAIQIAISLGAIYHDDRLTQETNLLVIGRQDMNLTKGSKMSGKQKKAIQYREKGLPIEWIDEGEFLRLISL